MMRLDPKYVATVMRIDGTILDPASYVIFHAGDDALLDALDAYRIAAESRGSPPGFIEHVNDLIQRVKNWRAANPDECHPPQLMPHEQAMRNVTKLSEQIDKITKGE